MALAKQIMQDGQWYDAQKIAVAFREHFGPTAMARCAALAGRGKDRSAFELIMIGARILASATLGTMAYEALAEKRNGSHRMEYRWKPGAKNDKRNRISKRAQMSAQG